MVLSEREFEQRELFDKARGHLYRGLHVRFPEELQQRIGELAQPPMTMEQYNQHQRIGPLIAEHVRNYDSDRVYRGGPGIGAHWTTDRGMAETAARAGNVGGWPVVVHARARPEHLSPRPTGMRSESEVTLHPNADVEITDIELPEGIEHGYVGRFRSVWPK